MSKIIFVLADNEKSIDYISNDLRIDKKFFIQPKKKEDILNTDFDEAIYILYDLWTLNQNIIETLHTKKVKSILFNSTELKQFIEQLV